jgi:hypothetical protein
MENVGEETRHVVELDGATSALQTVFEASGPGMLYVPRSSSDRPSSVESHRVAGPSRRRFLTSSPIKTPGPIRISDLGFSSACLPK